MADGHASGENPAIGFSFSQPLNVSDLNNAQQTSTNRQSERDTSRDVLKVGVWEKLDKLQIPSDLEGHYVNLKKYTMKSKADNTIKNYKCYFNSFCNWCKKYDFKSLPASDFHVGLFLSSVAESDPSESKVNSILHGISCAHNLAGLPDQCASEFIKNIKTGILKKVGRPSVPKQPIMSKDLEKLVSKFSDTNLMNMRFVSMSLLSFSGFLRFDEVIKLRCSDIVFDPVQVKVLIRSSKTDQLSKGSTVCIARTKQPTCPVEALEKYFHLGQLDKNSNDFLFRKVSFCKKTGNYVLRPGTAISYTRAREILLHNLCSIGLDAKHFGLHSFRSGGASSVVAHGVCDRLVKKHGRWKSENAKNLYIRESDEMKRTVSLNLGI